MADSANTLPSLLFLPTPSARRATIVNGSNVQDVDISTHALREEGDIIDTIAYWQQNDFYPRPPRGGRPCWDTCSHSRQT